MENCEKLNKELIERIKNEYEKADGITRESLERILPELKKPDDNEIREEILECIKYLEKNICHPARYTRKQYESWIAWLENIPYTIDREKREGFHLGYKAGLEKQGEQKPVAKYKVGDTIYYDSFGRLVSFVIANIVEDGTGNPMYEDKDGNSVFQNDIVEQKPVWNEEDEKMLDFTIRAIGLCRQYAINHQVSGYSKLPDVPKRYEELQNWLKYLRPHNR